MGEARRLLSENRTVILYGAPGTGRTAAASVLLYEHRQDAGIFRELLPGDEEEGTLKDPGLVGAGDRLLLDLADADGDQWAEARKDLSALRQAVRDQRAHLVVVMPYEGALESDLRPYRAEITRPPEEEVFRRHLRLHRVPHDEYTRSAPALKAFLDEEPSMDDIAEFADRVRRIRTASSARDGFAMWCEQAREARKGWRKEVANRVTELREAPQRALLITTAMLHGAHADVIHQAADLLLSASESPGDDTPLLECKDLAERLKEISATVGPDGHVRFDKPDFDTAVRAHFWDHLPDLRQTLGVWTSRCTELADPYLTPELRAELVKRLADQYLRTGRWKDLALLTEKWSTAPTSRARLEAAVHALTRGLQNKHYDGIFRQQIYAWCFEKRLTDGLAHVLIRVCTDAIAPTHPDQALIRLYHLARRERGTTRAQDALCDLVATSGRLRRRMLDRLTGPSSHPATDLGLFLRVCDPVPLTDPGGAPRALVEEKAVQDCVTTGWREVLSGLAQRHWQPYAERWLHTASDTGDRGELLLDLLVDAAGKHGTTLATLYAVARAAEPTTPGGRASAAATTDLLFQKISEAQGLRPSRGNTS
ncbi:hypothetical protein [Streptomyces sp. NPDC053542]|uniref:hypothetical protein n=1 Tax=Streptomyces sp. NPDC053542 TaxID=3365710 RepID=UPI0037D03C6D